MPVHTRLTPHLVPMQPPPQTRVVQCQCITGVPGKTNWQCEIKWARWRNHWTVGEPEQEPTCLKRETTRAECAEFVGVRWKPIGRWLTITIFTHPHGGRHSGRLSTFNRIDQAQQAQVRWRLAPVARPDEAAHLLCNLVDRGFSIIVAVGKYNVPPMGRIPGLDARARHFPGLEYGNQTVPIVNASILTGINTVILATGFRYSLPFLPQYYDDATHDPHEHSAKMVSTFLPLDIWTNPAFQAHRQCVNGMLVEECGRVIAIPAYMIGWLNEAEPMEDTESLQSCGARYAF
ncbi:hypothetical protein L210DRAFT_3502063 [Boletus edulis BED1]|uniref:Uncharacterized protein n=1 Tax=Boletus edulis BED1 TaxID=1328754 RepID=A0AAD4BZU3_BOLED|nr:hypothetical protein L210DRAFT_3502063 [Boletus edulis BED1]